MGEDVSNCIDVTDFRFRCANKVQLFENWANLASPLQVVASASKYGLIFVGSPNALLVFKTSDLLDNGEQVGQECPRRIVPLEGIINLSVNCDDTLLMTVFVRGDLCQAFIFKVEAILTTQNIVPYGHIMLSNRAGQFLSEAAWNPTFPGYVSCCLTDGTLSMYEVKDQGVSIINTVTNAEARCVSWSPKGKQLVAGSRQGLLTQYNPELKPVKCHQVPQSLGSPAEALAVCWLSSFQFAVVYKIGSADDNRLTLCIVNAPKQGPVTCIDFEDVCYTAGELRPHQFYLYIQHTWGVLLCSSANAMEVGVLGQCEGQAQPPRWQQWTTEDSARAELPMQGGQDTYPLGMAVDTSCSKPLPYGEEEVSPMPVLALLSNRGTLCVFHIMNLKPSAGQVCSAPLTLPNALHQLFSIPTYATSSPQQPPAVQPSREQPPQFVQPQPIAQPIPQVPVQVAILKQPVQPIAQPIPQPMKPAVQVPVQPKAVQPSVQPKIVQPSAQIATAPAQQPPMATSTPQVTAPKPQEPREEEIPELPYETFILTLKRLNGIFKEEIVGSLSRYHDELNKVTWPPRTGDLDESFEELRKMALHLSQLLEEDTETESTVLRPLDEHQSKVYEDINANVTTKNMPGFAKLLRSRPLDSATAGQLKEVEQKVLYIDSELHQVADTLATLDCRDLKKDKFGLPQKMATNRTQVYLLKVLQFLENKHKMLQKEASNDPNIMYSADTSFLGMNSLSEALNSIPVLRRSPLTPRSYKVEEILSELTDDDVLPEVDALSPVFSPIKAMSAKAKPPVCDFATWRDPSAVPTTPVTTRAPNPDFTTPKTFGAFSNPDSTPPPFGAFKPPSAREEIITPEPEETSAASNLASLAKLTEKAAPSFGLSSLMVGQTTGKPETSKAFSAPQKTSVFGGSAVFNAPKFDAVSSKPSDFVASSPVSFSAVQKPSTMFGGTTTTTSASVFSATPVFGGTKTATTTSAPVIFGGQQSSDSSIFGKSVFGATTSPSVFGGSKTTPTDSAINLTAPTKTTSEVVTTMTSSATTTVTTASSLFGSSSTPMFGGKSSMFGSGSSTSPAPFSFSLAPTAGFGSFSASTTSATTTTPSKPLFGSVTSTTAAITTPPVSTVTATTTPTSTTTPSLFGGTTATFGGASAATPSLFGGAATSTPSLFGGTTTAATKPSLFGNLSSSTTVSASPVFGTSSTSTVAATTSPLFASVTSSPVSATSSPTTTAATATVGTATTTPTVGTSSPSSVTPITSTATPAFGTPSSGTAPVLGTIATSTTPVVAPTITMPAFGIASATAPAFGSLTSKTTPVLGATTTATTTISETTTASETIITPGTTTTTVAFGTTTTPSFSSGSLSVGKTVFAPGSTTEPAVFGSATTTATPAFGTGSSMFGTASTPSVFGSASAANTTASTASVFVGASTATPSTTSVFGGASTPASTPSTPVFGGASAATPSTASVFGAASTATPSTASVFGGASTATPSTASVFGGTSTATPSAASVFGGASTTPTTSQFGTPLFSSVFGSTAATTATPTFGTPTAPSAFATNVFGQVASPQTSDSTAQVSNMFGGMMGSSSGGSMFGGSTSFAATKSPNSIFGGGQQSTPDNSQNLFGSVQACSPSVNKNLFGASSPQQNPFSKQPASAVFGQSPGGGSFSSSQNVFGQVAPGPFSQGGNTGPISFALSPGGSSNIFGGGAAGSSTFGSTSPTSGGFGAPPTFGGGPTFGGAPTFAAGSHSGMFGASSPGGSMFGGSPAPVAPTVQESSTFTALASQNTVGFGNLAQQSPQQQSGFGFGGGGFAQQPQPPTNNNNQAGGSTFNSSSFSSWR